MELVKILPSRETLKQLLNAVILLCFLAGVMYYPMYSLHRHIKAKGYAEGLEAGKSAVKSAQTKELMEMYQSNHYDRSESITDEKGAVTGIRFFTEDVEVSKCIEEEKKKKQKR